jgi:hypothetical protein
MEKDGTAPRTNYYLSPSRAGDIHRVPHCSAELRGFDDKIGFPFASLIDCFYLFLFASNPEDLALMSGAQLFMREDIGLTHEQVEVLSGSMNLFMLASILGGDWAADTAPRWSSPTRSSLAGALAMSLGGSFPVLMAACFVTSVGIGFALVVAPVYATEIGPTSARGLLLSAGVLVMPESLRWLATRGRDVEVYAIICILFLYVCYYFSNDIL